MREIPPTFIEKHFPDSPRGLEDFAFGELVRSFDLYQSMSRLAMRGYIEERINMRLKEFKEELAGLNGGMKND
jgi:hypothetical protein